MSDEAPVYVVQIDDPESGWRISVYSMVWAAQSSDGRYGYVMVDETREGQYWPWFCEWNPEGSRAG